MKPSTSFRQFFSLGLLLTVTLLGACSETGNSDTTTAAPPDASETPIETTENVETVESETATAPAQAPAQAPARAPNAAPAKNPDAYDRPVEVYWLTDEDNAVELMSIPATEAAKSTAAADQLQNALETLLAGPDTEDDRSTTIPPETALRQIEIKPDGVHVDLSDEFTSGGGSLSMTARVAQVLYTATSANPEGSMWLKVEGEPLKVLGGEGIILEQPLTREYFETNFDL
ncbi:MAG: GerMN domain-containing protein [Cyanobacteria bacterium P01_G01_bin.54]